MSSLTVRALIVKQLYVNAGLGSNEPVYNAAPDLVDAAFMEHNSEAAMGGRYDLLSPREYELVGLLAWERVCLARASLAAPQSSVKQSQVSFNADRDTPFEKNQKLATYLRARYNQLKAAYKAEASASGESDIIVGELFRKEDTFNAVLPLSVGEQVTIPAIKVIDIKQPALASATGRIVLSVDIAYREMVDTLFLYAHTASGIAQPWNPEVPVIPAATLVGKTTDMRMRMFSFDNLLAGTYYFVAYANNVAGVNNFSGEIKVVLENAS